LEVSIPAVKAVNYDPLGIHEVWFD
jgi:hypothetical protein